MCVSFAGFHNSLWLININEKRLPLPVNCVWWTFYDTWSILRPQMCLRELYRVAQLNCSRIIQNITKLYLRGLYRVTQSNTVSYSWEGYTRLTEHCPTGKERWRSVMVNLTYIKEEVKYIVTRSCAHLFERSKCHNILKKMNWGILLHVRGNT